MSNIPVEEFDSLTKQFFGFLIHEYHFALKKKNDFSYDFEMDSTRISIFVEYNVVVVGMVPIGEADRMLRQKNILPEQLEITVVARGLKPDLDYKVIWDEPIESAMERESQILKNDCQDFLRGDFTK